MKFGHSLSRDKARGQSFAGQLSHQGSTDLTALRRRVSFLATGDNVLADIEKIDIDLDRESSKQESANWQKTQASLVRHLQSSGSLAQITKGYYMQSIDNINAEDNESEDELESTSAALDAFDQVDLTGPHLMFRRCISQSHVNTIPEESFDNESNVSDMNNNDANNNGDGGDGSKCKSTSKTGKAEKQKAVPLKTTASVPSISRNTTEKGTLPSTVLEHGKSALIN